MLTKSSAYKRKTARLKRHSRVRRKVEGTTERPRLAVFRSATNIYAQVIDDSQQKTLCSASTVNEDLKQKLAGKTGGNCEAAKLVGQKIAQLAKDAGVEKVAFDKGGFQFHGRVKVLAEAAREVGLDF